MCHLSAIRRSVCSEASSSLSVSPARKPLSSTPICNQIGHSFIYVELNTILDSFLTGSVKKQERIFLWNLKNFPTHLWKILKSLFNFNFLLSFCYQILSWLYMLLPYLIYSLPAAFLKPPLHLRDEMLNSLLRWRYQLQLTKKFLLSIDCIISMPAF